MASAGSWSECCTTPARRSGLRVRGRHRLSPEYLVRLARPGFPAQVPLRQPTSPASRRRLSLRQPRCARLPGAGVPSPTGVCPYGGMSALKRPEMPPSGLPSIGVRIVRAQARLQVGEELERSGVARRRRAAARIGDVPVGEGDRDGPAHLDARPGASGLHAERDRLGGAVHGQRPGGRLGNGRPGGRAGCPARWAWSA